MTNTPWPMTDNAFEIWFNSHYKFYFGTKWLRPIFKKVCASGWDAAILSLKPIYYPKDNDFPSSHSCGWMIEPGTIIRRDEPIFGPYYCPKCNEVLGPKE